MAVTASGKYMLRAINNPATRNRTRDHLITAQIYSQMLCQLSYSRDESGRPGTCIGFSRAWWEALTSGFGPANLNPTLKQWCDAVCLHKLVVSLGDVCASSCQTGI